MQCPACQLPLPPDAACPFCPPALAPALADPAGGLAPALAPRVVELRAEPGWRGILEGLPPDSTVRLAPGSYRFGGGLRLPPGLTLDGTGATLEGAGAEGDWSLLSYRGPGLLTLRGLTLRTRGGFWQRILGRQEAPHVLGVLGGAFLLEGCTFPALEDGPPEGDWPGLSGYGVIAPEAVPGTVVGCRFAGRHGGSTGLRAHGPLWVVRCTFRHLDTGVRVYADRLAVSDCRFEENALGLDWSSVEEATEAGCLVQRCAFVRNQRDWQVLPTYRGRWTDNRYER